MKHEKTFAPKTGWGPLCLILILFVSAITTFVIGIGWIALFAILVLSY